MADEENARAVLLSPAQEMAHQRYEKENQKDVEQNLRDSCRSQRDP
jgi:hypothetical protein